MEPPFLPGIDILSYTTETKGLNAKTLSYLKHVTTQIDSSTIENALKHLQQTIGRYETSFDARQVDFIDDVVSLLDSGASQVFVSYAQAKQLFHYDNLDAHRTVICLNASEPVPEEILSSSSRIALHLSNISSPEAVDTYLDKCTTKHGPVYTTLVDCDTQTALNFVKSSIKPIIPATSLTLDVAANPDSLSVPELLLANAESDRPDGLLTTMVTDERGIALGLVYSSKESVAESLKTGRGVYQSRKRGLWYKGESSGDVQELLNISFDCDFDCIRFAVTQKGRGFCHLGTATCFGRYNGMSRLQQTLRSRKASAPEGSYTARLFSDSKLLNAKIKEEADELCNSTSTENTAFEAADLMYFALTKCIAAGVSLEDVERNLDAKSVKVKRRRGDAKEAYVDKSQPNNSQITSNGNSTTPASPTSVATHPKDELIKMRRFDTSVSAPSTITKALQRPSQRSTDSIMSIVRPIISDVQQNGDAALLKYTHKFEKATSLSDPVLKAPFPDNLMQISKETQAAIDLSYDNIYKFHAAQKESAPLKVETMPGVLCSRFVRPIARVGLYVPGGTAVLPSSAMMLGVPALVAGCKKIVLATPPRQDGSLTPEIVYIAHKIGAESIVLAGGAQAIAALAYGTDQVSKVDKILGPGNQFVTAAKMLVANDTSANVAIDMPAGPSEVLVIADSSANPAFVAADLLSQAEHGADSQVVCIAVAMSEEELKAIEDELHRQAMALPRVDIVKKAIDHSVTLVVGSIQEALALSNEYAPEHLILQCENPREVSELVENAGSVFIGKWTPESVGDYSAGVNHSLPTYGYARQYSGVNLGSYVKHITSSELTEDGLKSLGGAVMQLASVEGLVAHARAVSVRVGVHT